MMKNKINPSVDKNHWLKSLEPTNQNLIKVPKVWSQPTREHIIKLWLPLYFTVTVWNLVIGEYNNNFNFCIDSRTRQCIDNKVLFSSIHNKNVYCDRLELLEEKLEESHLC